MDAASQKRIAELENKISDATKKNKSLQQELDELGRLRKSITSLYDELCRQQKQKESLVRSVTAGSGRFLQSVLKTVREEVNNSESAAKRRSIADSLDKLAKKKRDIEYDIDENKARITRWKAEIEKIRQEAAKSAAAAAAAAAADALKAVTGGIGNVHFNS